MRDGRENVSRALAPEHGAGTGAADVAPTVGTPRSARIRRSLGPLAARDTHERHSRHEKATALWYRPRRMLGSKHLRNEGERRPRNASRTSGRAGQSHLPPTAFSRLRARGTTAWQAA
ncbi:hypothetical protein GCM10023405_11460 [Streptomonospora salina]